MSKIQLFFLSLVGAVPAAYLSYLLVMYLINQPSGASSMVMILAIITLLCSATLSVIPVLVLAMYYSNYDPPKAPKAVKDKGKGKGKDKDKDEDEYAEEESADKESSEDLSDSKSDVGEIEELSSSDDLAMVDDDLIDADEEEDA